MKDGVSEATTYEYAEYSTYDEFAETNVNKTVGPLPDGESNDIDSSPTKEPFSRIKDLDDP